MSFKKDLHVYNTHNIKCTSYGHCMIIKHEMSLVKNYSKNSSCGFLNFTIKNMVAKF